MFVGRLDRSLGLPTEADIRSLFANFDIESVREPNTQEKEDGRVTNCVIVHFAKWGECGVAARVSVGFELLFHDG